MRKTAIVILIWVPIALVGLMLIEYGLKIPQPVGGEALYKDKVFFPQSVVGDQLLGGGYLFPPDDGRDIWVRIHTTTNLSGEPLLGSLSTCSPKNFKKIQTWFLDRVTSQTLFGFIPTSRVSQVDQAILRDEANLRCGDSGDGYAAFETSFGKPPKDCTTSWALYHKPSGFYYKRVACQF